jgi:nitroreductase
LEERTMQTQLDTSARAIDSNSATAIDSIMRSRVSVRAFLPTPVPRSLVSDILDVARTAPSTFNTQPWRVHVLAGAAKQALSEKILAAHRANTHPNFSPFPNPQPTDCAARQNEFGGLLYKALGIDRSDSVGRGHKTTRNYMFFGAPVGLIFTIDGTLTKHSWLDYGLFLQNVMLAAYSRGIATCPQVSFVRYQSVIAHHLRLSPCDAVVCGMSLGYADEKAAVNDLAMPREEVDAFAAWEGFED